MKIKTSYNSLVSLLNLMSIVTSAKGLQEDFKVINLFVKENKLHILGTDSQIYCLDTLDGTYDLEGEVSPFMVIRIKETMDILSKFATLQRTQVKEIHLETQQKGVVMTVVEEPKALKDGFSFPELYKNQLSRFKLTRTDVKTMVVRELPTMVLPIDAIEMKSKDFQKYLEYMYTPMTKPKETSFMHFNDEFVYSVMGNVYGIAMPNILSKDIFTSLSLPLHYINFLRNVIPMNETFTISKEVELINRGHDLDDSSSAEKKITLVIQSGSILIKLKLGDNSKSISTDTFKQPLQNTVEVDKPYFIDTFKRIDSFDFVYIEINITEDPNVTGTSTAEFIIKTQRTIQRIPVKCAHGSGEFKFTLRPESLSLMAFTHLTKDLDGNTDKVNDLIFYMSNVDSAMSNVGSATSLTCKDKTDDWQTRYPRAPYSPAPLLDF